MHLAQGLDKLSFLYHALGVIGSASIWTFGQTPASERPRTTLRFTLHVGPAPPERQEGMEGRAPPIWKDLAAASYGCLGAGRDDALEGGEET